MPAKKSTPKLHPALVDKLPTKVAQAGDLLYQTREARLAQQKIVDALAKQENDLKNFIIQELPLGAASGTRGEVARVEVNTVPTPQVSDEAGGWAAFYKHVLKTKDFSLMQRRVNESAIKERWDDGKKVPGIIAFNVVKVSCTKK